MAGKHAANAPWQELERQAYHAYREWHLWLALRERELAERLTTGRTDKRSSSVASAREGAERKPTGKEG